MILIGGIPRSGTTALARAFAQHRDLAVFPFETGLFPLMADLVGEGPLPEASVETAAGTLRRNLAVACSLVELLETDESWGFAASPRDARQALADLYGRADHLVRGGAGPAIVRDLTCAFEQTLGLHGDRLAVEKTPGNALHAGWLAGPLGRPLLLTVRNPVAVVSSMRRRAADARDPSATQFGRTLEETCGVYLEYGHAIAATMAATAPPAAIVPYEALRDSAGAVMRVACRSAGVDPAALDVERVGAFVGPGAEAPVTLDADTQALIVKLTAAAARPLGYTPAWLHGNGFAVREHVAPAAVADAGVHVLWGCHREEGGRPWMSRRAAFAAYVPRHGGTLALALWMRFPDEVRTRRPRLRCTIRVNGQPVRSRVLDTPGAGGLWLEDRVDLAANRLDPLTRTLGLALVEIESDLSFRPIRSLPGSGDVRDLFAKVARLELE